MLFCAAGVDTAEQTLNRSKIFGTTIAAAAVLVAVIQFIPAPLCWYRQNYPPNNGPTIACSILKEFQISVTWEAIAARTVAR